jgi:hypothetical protein
LNRTTTHEPTRFAWLFTGWRSVLVRLLAVIALVACASNVVDAVQRLAPFGLNGQGVRGFASEKLVGQPGWERITAVTPKGAAAQAGLVPGMRVHFDLPFQANAHIAAGRTIGLAVSRDGANQPGPSRHVTLVTLPANFTARTPAQQFGETTYMLAVLLALILGAIALVRGWGSVTALAFGIGILGFGLPVAIPMWATDPAMAGGIAFALAISKTCKAGLWLIPAALYAERIRAPSRGWITVFVLTIVTHFAVAMFSAWCAVLDVGYPLIGDGKSLIFLYLFSGIGPAIVWIGRGLRDATGGDRSRFAAIGVVLVFLVAGYLYFAITLLTGIDVTQLNVATAILLGLPGNVLLPLSLAYAVLRHRLVDLGFALNRTVVYATFSAILLGTFGLIEWGVEHLLPEQWIKASAWIDAGVAVLVYLAFHRVHGAVEQRVEHVFFGQWQRNEDALRRFVGSAAYFEDARALARAFADELSRFGGDARVAIYRRNDGVLDRVGGTWDAAPRHFREDDPAFALMRAERAPLDLEATHTDLPGVLALPMLDHGVLAGLVLMDLKGNGALYRPDEVALLGWAAHEVGLALAALHAGLIETENRLLKAQLARIGSIIGDRLDRVGA